ncbi:MAG: hypothetical protein J2P41_10390 [Blastocatellia bacterium]|nr:hypothetical protein [Blastocatellia bacterium]
MKQDETEKTIRELFQKLKREDERHAPAFTDVFAAARERLEESRSLVRSAGRLRRNWRWSLVAAASILIAGSFIAYHEIRHDSGNRSKTIKETSTAPAAPIKHESEATRVAVGTGTRRSTHAPRPRRSNRANFKTSPISDRFNAAVKEREDTTEFISLRYGDDNEPMESGDVIRVLMPRSALVTLGLPVNVLRADEPVMADLLIGEDGLARAIRFVR